MPCPFPQPNARVAARPLSPARQLPCRAEAALHVGDGAQGQRHHAPARRWVVGSGGGGVQGRGGGRSSAGQGGLGPKVKGSGTTLLRVGGLGWKGGKGGTGWGAGRGAWGMSGATRWVTAERREGMRSGGRWCRAAGVQATEGREPWPGAGRTAGRCCPRVLGAEARGLRGGVGPCGLAGRGCLGRGECGGGLPEGQGVTRWPTLPPPGCTPSPQVAPHRLPRHHIPRRGYARNA